MTIGTVLLWVLFFVGVAFLIWFFFEMLRFLLHAVTYQGRPSSSSRYPDGADEPDGSSYAEVNGEVRLE
jgi:hypothetical protein